MIFALDYDETFTADKMLWTAWVHHAKQRGHEVSFVTFRTGPSSPYRDDDNADIKHDAEQLNIPIVFCNHRQKKHCFVADVWIDDMPELIVSHEDMHNALIFHELKGDTE